MEGEATFFGNVMDEAEDVAGLSRRILATCRQPPSTDATILGQDGADGVCLVSRTTSGTKVVTLSTEKGP